MSTASISPTDLEQGKAFGKEVSEGQIMEPTQEAIGEVAAAFGADPSAAQINYKSSSKLKDGLKSEVTFEGGQNLIVDEPEMMPGGKNAGVNPLDLFLASIGSCQEITYKAYATAMDIPLTKVAVAMDGDVDLAGFLMVNPDAKRGFGAIRGTVTVTSSATQEKLEQLRAAVDAHCPMSDTVGSTVPLALELEHFQTNKAGDQGSAAPSGNNDGLLSAEAIGELQATIKADPGAGQINYKSSGELTAGLQSRVTFPDSGHGLVMDEPEDFPGGGNTGPNPLEVALASLGTCQEITYKAFGVAMGIPIDSVSCQVSGDCDLRGLLGVDESVPKGFSAIKCTVGIESPATTDQIKQLKAAVDAHCPMVETLSTPVPMQLEFAVHANTNSGNRP